MSLVSSRQPSLGAQLRLDAGPARVVALGGALAIALCAVGLLVQRFSTPVALGAVVFLAAVTLLFRWPDAATIAVAFLLYTNIPALAARRGVPVLLTSSFLLLLGFPLLHHLVARRSRIRMDRAFDLMLLFLIVLLFSALGAKNPAAAGERVLEFVLEGLVLYWLLINVMRTLPAVRRVLWTVMAVGAMLGGFTLYQEATGSKQEFGGLAPRNDEYSELRKSDDPEVRELLQTFTGDQRTSRPLGPVAQPNRFAQILLVLLPFAVFLHRTGRSRTARVCAFACGTLILVGVALTQSRGAFLNLILLTMAMVAAKWARLSRVFVAAVGLFVVASVTMPDFLARLQTIENTTSLLSDDPVEQANADAAIRGRTTVMLAALNMFLDYPVLGVGPGQSKYYVQEYSERNPEIQFRELETTRRAHSLYLEMAADVGVIGLVAFLAIVLHLVHSLWRARRLWLERRPDYADLATGCLLSLMAYLGTGMTEHLSYQRYYWFLLAVAGAALQVLRGQSPESQTAEPPSTAGRAPAWASADPRILPD